MKRKLIIISVIIVVLFLSVIIITPLFFKSKLLKIIKTEVNKTLVATVDFNENLHISIIKSFPDLYVKINDVSIANKEPFLGDTLAYISSFAASIDLKKAIKGKIEIKEIKISDARIYLHVLNDTSDYIANWDITLPSTDTTSESDSTVIKIPIKKILVYNTDFIYDDELYDVFIDAKKINITGKGDFSMDIFDLITNGNIEQLSFKYDGIPYISKAKTRISTKTNIDMTNYKYTFNETSIYLNEFLINVDGHIAMPTDDIEIDMKFNSPQTEFKNLLSLIPSVYASDFSELSAKGSVNFSGFVKGIYNSNSMPGFDIQLNVKDGMFRYPDLPASVSNVNLALHVNNPDGVMDNTVINLQKLYAQLGKEVFNAKVLVKTPISDPFIDAHVKGKINIANVRDFIKIDEKLKLSGLLDLDLTAIGKMSYIEKQQYEKFQANGNLNISQLYYYDDNLKKEIQVALMQLLFNPKAVELKQLKLNVGKNDLSAQGSLLNFIPYMFSKGVLSGKLNLQSNNMNINEFLIESENATSGTATSTTTTETEKTATTVFELPGNIDFMMDARFANLIYDKMNLKNAVCNLKLNNKRLTINNLMADVLNGKIEMKGYYETVVKDKPVFDFNLKIENMEVKSAYNTFEVVKKYVPIAAFSKGNINANLVINSLLQKNMMPNFATLFSKGSISIAQLGIVNFKPLNLAADALEIKTLKNPTLKSIKPSYIIRDGKLKIDPVKFKIDKTDFTVSGWNGLDKSMNYEIIANVPIAELKNKSSNYLSSLGISNIANLTGETVPVYVYITGNYDNPKIKTSVKKMTQTVTEAAKDKAKEEIDKQRQNVENAARLEAERQQKLLQEKAKQEQERLRLEAEKKKKDLEEKARLEAEKKKKQLEEEAKKKLKGIIK